MGLIEYQAMPSLRDLAHDGWLCTFTVKQKLEITSARRSQGNRYGTEKADSTAHPSCTISHLQGHSLASQAGRRVGPAF